MTDGKCSVAGCGRPAVVRVGPGAEPMCQDDYDRWLAGHRRCLDAFHALLGFPRRAETADALERERIANEGIGGEG